MQVESWRAVTSLCVKQNIKHLEMDKYIITTYPLQ